MPKNLKHTIPIRMKPFFYLLSFLLLLSCSKSNSSTEEKAASSTSTLSPELVAEYTGESGAEGGMEDAGESGIDYLDASLKNKLESLFPSAPYYARIGDQQFFLVSNIRDHNYEKPLESGALFGIAGSDFDLILPVEYEKICNPNTVASQCFEVVKKGKAGLFNYETGKVLSPQFDFIMPSESFSDHTAYGFKNGNWYKINTMNFEQSPSAGFDPSRVIVNTNYDITKFRGKMLYSSLTSEEAQDVIPGNGVIFTPSWLSHFGILEPSYPQIIPDSRGDIWGTEELEVKTIQSKSISDKLKTFLVSAWESGIDARGYSIEESHLVSYDAGSGKMVAEKLGDFSPMESPYICDEESYTKFLNDSIIEIRKAVFIYQAKDDLYPITTTYNYIKLLPDGRLERLDSDRIFDFTKFIFIDESKFHGCFARYVEDDGQSNMEQTEYLSVDDLDLMRNEIFADYGYIFKSDKWKEHFSAQGWYKPRFDNVDDRLTEIDKANIQVILEMKEKILKNEGKYTQKKKVSYEPAG